AKLANNTVNHSQRVTRPTNTLSDAVAEGSFWKNRIVVRTLPSSTTNITGLRAIWRGSSFTNESPIARRTMAGSNIEVAEARWRPFGGRGGAGSTTSATGALGVVAVTTAAPQNFPTRCSTTGPSAM